MANFCEYKGISIAAPVLKKEHELSSISCIVFLVSFFVDVIVALSC